MIKNKWNNHKLAAESMAFLMVCLFLLFSFWNPVMSYAKDSFLAGYNTQMEILSTIDTKLAELKKATAELEDIVAKAAEKEDDPKAWAKYYHDVVFAFFDTVRKPADELEKIVDAKAWPFPTYEELLFEQ